MFYILKIFIYNINYMNIKYIHVNIFKIYNVCEYLYIHNKYTQYTHTYYVNKKLYFGCD